MFKIVVIATAGILGMLAQMSDKSSPKVVPITEEQHHHLVLDNEYVRVFHVEVAPHSETKYHQHDMDYVFVTLGDSKVASERVDGKSVTLELKDGETRFTKGGFAHKAVNLSDKPFVNYTIELKKNSTDPITTAFDRCAGALCDEVVMVSSSVRCHIYSAEGAVSMTQRGTSRQRLVIALTKTSVTDRDDLKAGAMKWVNGDVHLGDIHGFKAVVLEFAREREDFLKK
jgi:quercetin dioxygenase-like cupin family protein